MMTLIHLLFVAIIAITFIGAYWLSKKFKERAASDENMAKLWKKTGIIIAIEIISWIVLAVITKWILKYPWVAIIIGLLIIIIIFARKKQNDSIY